MSSALSTRRRCTRWRRERPSDLADESSDWNLQRIDSSYTRTKRQAERMVLEASGGGFTTIALCPGMVLGPRDPKPTSTQIVRELLADR